MSLLENISNIGKGVKDFFAGETVKNIADGAYDILNFMKEKSGSDTPLVSLVNPDTKLGGQVALNFKRSTAKQPSFSDIQEASFYKYAQLQNTVRYLYSQKSRYKSIAKDKA